MPVIIFNEILSGIKKPQVYIEFDTKAAVRSLPTNRYNLTIIAGMTPAGSLSGEPIERRTVYSDAEAAELYGAGSQAHLMVRAALKSNRYVDINVIGVDDAAGTPAVGTLTFTAAATSSGVNRLWIGEELIESTVTNGDAVGTLASNLDTAIGKLTNVLPIANSVALGVVTFTCKNDGTPGNEIPLRWETTASGVAATLVPMASGATDPSIDEAGEALALIEPTEDDIIVTPWNDATTMGQIKTHIDFVSGPLEMRPSICFHGAEYHATRATYIANAKTLADAMNHGRFFIVASYGAMAPSWLLAAAAASVAAGETDPAKPLDGLKLHFSPPSAVNNFTRTEIEDMLNNGLFPLEKVGSELRMVRFVSTYQTDGVVPDISLFDGTTIRIFDYMRAAYRQRLTLRFKRGKKTARVKAAMKSEIIDVSKRAEEIELVENVNDNIDGIIIQDNAQDPTRVDIVIPVDVVNGLHVVAIQMQLIL